ncbi:MAG: hypothetical protein SP1CHLAM54_14590 [Chlamydiia bacterium]|nr:hypothetical protein [Chlamydiia bacterium]MCH9616350.1 hypothetical protein [Chlamydiia bacterium]MCH9629664.1 hypothetical protein [Chlamydiia bacterium]
MAAALNTGFIPISTNSSPELSDIESAKLFVSEVTNVAKQVADLNRTGKYFASISTTSTPDGRRSSEGDRRSITPMREPNKNYEEAAYFGRYAERSQLGKAIEDLANTHLTESARNLPIGKKTLGVCVDKLVTKLTQEEALNRPCGLEVYGRFTRLSDQLDKMDAKYGTDGCN